jgi:hypothetical protein
MKSTNIIQIDHCVKKSIDKLCALHVIIGKVGALGGTLGYSLVVVRAMKLIIQ